MGFRDFLKKATKFGLPAISGALGGLTGKALDVLGGGGESSGVNFSDPATRNRLLVSPLEKQSRIDRLLRSVGSLQSQQLNRSRDTASFLGLPAATRLAQESNIAGKIGSATSSGIGDIEQDIGNQNRLAEQFLLTGQATQHRFDLARKDQRRRDLFNLFGSVAQAGGRAVGASLGGGS